MHMGICLYINLYTMCMPGACGGQKRLLDPFTDNCKLPFEC